MPLTQHFQPVIDVVDGVYADDSIECPIFERQRLSGVDRQYEEEADALSEPPPQTEHLIAADAHYLDGD